MKILVIILFLLSYQNASYAQESKQGVIFEEGSLTEAYKTAKDSDKYLFVDVYTSWCGPCKKVAMEVFPNEDMGDFYNSKFINYKLNGEKGEGAEFVKKYNINSYPTFLFLDSNGKVIHRLSGAKSAEEFIKEGKMVKMYARHGGYETMMEQLQNGNASKELLYDYFLAAPKEKRPVALNHYMHALSDSELISEHNKHIEELSVYDSSLMSRFIKLIINESKSPILEDNEQYKRFNFNLQFPIQYDLSNYIATSIKENNQKQLAELLDHKRELTKTARGKKLDGDINVKIGRGLFFATDNYIQLNNWTQNRIEEREFIKLLPVYMDSLISEFPLNKYQISNADKQYIEMLKVKPGNPKDYMVYFANLVMSKYALSTTNIIAWSDYFWRISPNNKQTKELCYKWINYACTLNTLNPNVIFPASELLVRIGNEKLALNILETAIKNLQVINYPDKKLFISLENQIKDIKAKKL